jgi:hypothetical protein
MAKSGTSRRKTAKSATEPRLGIFWLVKGKLLIDSVALAECEKYGDHLNYPGSHIRVWERLQKVGIAPVESLYEEYPRGRAVRSSTGFSLLADRCILNRKDLIAAIKKELYLPKQTSLGTDPHYRCFQCLHGNADDEE